ncbi:hypothetical protein [Streptomyces sp. NPDC020965]|uniref:hypothetical protein n=1 Tax=Streptomyces sp. NPDC020965 TaxID=3365105 RepID=UPI00378ED276
MRNDVSGQARAGGVIQTGVVRGDVTLGRQDPRAPRGRDRNTDPDRDPDRAPGRSTDPEG